MPPQSYRYYRLDGAGHLDDAEWFFSATDRGAIAQVEAQHPETRCEVWQGSRLVAKLSPSQVNPDDPGLQNAVGERLSALARKVRLGLEP